VIPTALRRLGRVPGILLFPLFAASVLAAPEDTAAPRAAKRVLFIGNSLTDWNRLPDLVAALSDAGGAPRLACQSVVAGGYSLEDHWNDGRALAAIRRGPWDFVVLQQGPSASEEGRRLLRQYSQTFAREIRKAGAVPALYMVWPSNDRRTDLSAVRDSYRRAARDVAGVFLPAGEAWREAWKKDPSLPLYSSDGLHPTPAGSYLAALVVSARLADRSPLGMPGLLMLPGGGEVRIPAQLAALLQQAAAEALSKLDKP